MKIPGIIVATIAMMLFASETVTWEGFAIQLGAGAVLALLFMIWKRKEEQNGRA